MHERREAEPPMPSSTTSVTPSLRAPAASASMRAQHLSAWLGEVGPAEPLGNGVLHVAVVGEQRRVAARKPGDGIGLDAGVSRAGHIGGSLRLVSLRYMPERAQTAAAAPGRLDAARASARSPCGLEPRDDKPPATTMQPAERRSAA